jgi:hypothetical protein
MVLLIYPKYDVSIEPPETLRRLNSSKCHVFIILSVPASQRMSFCLTNIKPNHWMLLRVTIWVQFKDHRKHASALCDKMHSFRCIEGTIYCAHFDVFAAVYLRIASYWAMTMRRWVIGFRRIEAISSRVWRSKKTYGKFSNRSSRFLIRR